MAESPVAIKTFLSTEMLTLFIVYLFETGVFRIFVDARNEAVSKRTFMESVLEIPRTLIESILETPVTCIYNIADDNWKRYSWVL